MIAPKIQLVAFLDRSPAFIFVAVPNERGRYLRTDRSVALAECGLCGAIAGEPCFRLYDGVKKYHATTHHRRRLAAQKISDPPSVGDLIEPSKAGDGALDWPELIR